MHCLEDQKGKINNFFNTYIQLKNKKTIIYKYFPLHNFTKMKESK